MARALAFRHSRLYFNENTLRDLKTAYQNKAFGFDDYCAELTSDQRGLVQWEHIRSVAQDFIRKNPNADLLQETGQRISEITAR